MSEDRSETRAAGPPGSSSAGAVRPEPLLALAPGATVTQEAGQRVVSAGGPRVSCPGGALGELVERLARDGASSEQLADQVLRADGYPRLAELYGWLGELADAGLLGHRLDVEGAAVAFSLPIAPGYRLDIQPAPAADRLVLSRFTFARRDRAALVLESPCSRVRVRIDLPSAWALVARLAAPQTAAELAALEPAAPYTQALLNLLWNGGMLSRCGPDDSEEERRPELLQWEFHDLLFHARSRRGRHAEPYGGTYRLRGILPPLPAAGGLGLDHVIPLARSAGAASQVPAPFTEVIERRRSDREHGAIPLTAALLGEFLYRAARAHGQRAGAEMEISQRVYPGGGAAYELEIYLVIDRCEGLDGGLYHYCPFRHALARRTGPSVETSALLASAARTARTESPQVLLVLAARFRRVFYKYSSIGYSTILKDVGVLFQNMYLVATAMRLAACALGGGDSDLFARASGLDYYEEGAVGEFILGSRPPR